MADGRIAPSERTMSVPCAKCGKEVPWHRCHLDVYDTSGGVLGGCCALEAKALRWADAWLALEGILEQNRGVAISRNAQGAYVVEVRGTNDAYIVSSSELIDGAVEEVHRQLFERLS